MNDRPCPEVRRARRGGVATWAAVAVVPLGLVAAGGVELTRALEARAQLQAVLDAATLTGAIDGSANWTDPAQKSFDRQIMRAANVQASRTFTRLSNGDFQGSASMGLITVFGGVVGRPTTTISATSVVRRPPPVPTPAPPTPPPDACPSAPVRAACILALDPTGGNALLFNSNSTLDAPDCEVHARSSNATALMFNAGARLNAARTCVRGDARWNAPRPASANFQGGCTPWNDPYVNRIPAPPFPGCTRNGGVVDPPSGGGATVMPAGGWCGDVNFNGNQRIVLGPGVHFFRNGRMNVNGGSSIEADRAVLYFEDQNSFVRMNGPITLTQTPPQSGPYAGVSMFEPPGLPESQFVFNTGNHQQTKGLIYLPSREVVFNSNSRSTVEDGQMIVRRFIINSDAVLRLTPYSGVNAVIPGAPIGGGAPPATPTYPVGLSPTPASGLGPELIVNGSFESVSGPQTNFHFQGSDGATIAGWRGAPDWEVHVAGSPRNGLGMATMSQAFDGRLYAEVDADAGADRLEQTVTGEAGATYEIDFRFAAKIADPDSWVTNQFDVYWNDVFVARIQPSSVVDWTRATFRVTGVAGPNVLSFRELPCTDNNRGGLIDMVGVRKVLTPPPGDGAPFLVR